MNGNEPSPQIWERKKLGLEARQRFELYLVSLIFTLAALSVQTAKPAPVPCLGIVEILGWLALFVSGGIGLWRVSKLWLREVKVADFQSQQLDLSVLAETFDAKISRWGLLQAGSFALGLTLLLISRGAALIYAQAAATVVVPSGMMPG